MISLTKFFRLFLVSLLVSGAHSEFEADVRWSCSEDVVSVFVRTSRPFEGIVQTRSSDSEACRVQGFGTNVAVLKLNLKSTECGIKYDVDSRTHSVTVDVHSHPVLIVEGDKSVNITCREMVNGTQHFVSHGNVQSPDYQLRVLSSRLPVETVKYSQPYTLQIRPLSNPSQASADSFFVGQCIAQPVGGNVSVQLTDPVGCALFKSIMGHFTRREYVEEAEIPSMFRFPNAKQLMISCTVTECDGKCEERTCDSDSSASSLLERTTASTESEEFQKVSVIVNLEEEEQTPEPLVAELADDEVVHHVARDAETPPPTLILQKNRDEVIQSECYSQTEFNILYYLCIFLAICSIIGFTMNIVLALILRRRSMKSAKRKKILQVEQLQIPKSSVVQPDFWIMENAKDTPEPESTYYAPARRDSFSSYASKPNRRIIPVSSEYGIPASRNSDVSSSEDRSSNEIYRRPNQISMARPEARHSNSTFMTHSTTMETDIDSQTSNQATSYH
uniref:ZP domain-containing protein n=1 Tax=Caenorhabditis tropicalis TaxID=1561998 RepID=A0A1I7UFP7_9PELO